MPMQDSYRLRETLSMAMAPSISTVSVRTPDGSEKSLGAYAGKVLLIVNVASRCGFTQAILRPPGAARQIRLARALRPGISLQ